MKMYVFPAGLADANVNIYCATESDGKEKQVL